MKITLEDIIINDDIHQKTTDYLSKPRKQVDMVDVSIFEALDSVFTDMFISMVFANRVFESMVYLHDNRVRPEANSIQVMKDIPTHKSGHDLQNQITVNLIITNERDILFISLEEKGESDDNGYWMGIAYEGSELGFANLLEEIGMDFTKALRGHLLPPKPAPDGYDHSLSIVENTKKVCCYEDEMPSVLSSLLELIQESPTERRYVLTDDEVDCITYEDIWFHIPDTQRACFIYRNCLNESDTYVIIYDTAKEFVLYSLVGNRDNNNVYSLTMDVKLLADVQKSVEEELR